ncbi:MAG: hypothetical protein JNL74_07885 [Fibrobacteres bacterium]|nr:hypothetical protein [Fibrobacterota bacterium]
MELFNRIIQKSVILFVIVNTVHLLTGDTIAGFTTTEGFYSRMREAVSIVVVAIR